MVQQLLLVLTVYDKIAPQINCTSALDTLACLWTIHYTTLYPFIDSFEVDNPGCYPTANAHIMPNHPTKILHSGRFVHIPHSHGTNCDEGTDNAPVGVINTDHDIYLFLLIRTLFNSPSRTVRETMRLYLDDPAIGIPINVGSERFADEGY
ncbi:hypothetical protein K432DRAFT_409903 [Lepidopterella palustris CBS 459.81]|uniref:Uncharacterized protein n=1 Tax=Lepidopterella palustris CBS 459.81 TaxID=1314670 RepID=A0A8E2J9K8_9PEZI|nr:hypothetical protein K432DRAFT_409903 [Lepidopterella palustris CBS 459.81]